MVSCRQDMHDQPRYEPLQPSELFRDRRSERPLIPGTVARGFLRADEAMYTGKVNGQAVTTFPFPVTKDVIVRGRERFNIYCSPCHSKLGDGRGMIVQRGFSPPPSYHTDRLRNAPVGHFFDVITNGFGAMQSYAARVDPQDRWAIIAYIRALQLSRNARENDVPADKQQELAASPDTMPRPNPEREPQAGPTLTEQGTVAPGITSKGGQPRKVQRPPELEPGAPK